MAKIEGTMFVCDMCGSKLFVKRMESRFTHQAKGWDYHCETGVLCPACNSLFKDMLNDLKEKRLEEGNKEGEAICHLV